MTDLPFEQTVEMICGQDPRYRAEAYYFVREALDFTAKTLKKPAQGSGRHVSGRELLDGLRRFSLQEFGPMAKTVLNEWGILASEDFGEIVFNLVRSGKLGSTEEDRKEDFANGFDFNEAFVAPFEPKSVDASTRPPASGNRGRTGPGTQGCKA
jgi:uncharacterized repeat protein (TIGR04138 family)